MQERGGIFDNPFYVLGVSTRDSRQEILEKAEQRSLEIDYEVCQRARAQLINPKARLEAEISWLPGTSPKRATQIAERLRSSPKSIVSEQGLPVLAYGNAMVAALQDLKVEDDSTYIADVLKTMAAVFKNVSPIRVLQDINEDRAVSGFPEISDEQAIAEALSEHKRAVAAAVILALDAVNTSTLVESIAMAADQATDRGGKHADELLEQIVDLYETRVQRYLVEERVNVESLVNAINRFSPAGAGAIEPLIHELEATLRRWVSVAKPVQVLAKSRGTDHALSREVAGSVRSLGIVLFNRHDLAEQTKRLTALLQELFAELPEVAAVLDEDVGAIQSVEKANSEREKEVAFEQDVGFLFKEKLRVSTKSITLSGTTFATQSIVRVRWGATRHSINGIPTGTSYTVFIGDNSSYQNYSTRDSKGFSEFVDKVWRVVGIRLMGELLTGLGSGGAYRFGEIVLYDDGVILLHRKFIGTEKIKRSWSEVKIWSANGQFVIGDSNDKNTFASASYIEHDNTHILEATIRAAFKVPGLMKLSELLTR